MTLKARQTQIIPISKLLGNYNYHNIFLSSNYIIPISKLLGNYNGQAVVIHPR